MHFKKWNETVYEVKHSKGKNSLLFGSLSVDYFKGGYQTDKNYIL